MSYNCFTNVPIVQGMFIPTKYAKEIPCNLMNMYSKYFHKEAKSTFDRNFKIVSSRSSNNNTTKMDITKIAIIFMAYSPPLEI